MGKIIASTYEIMQEIGSGGGGTVYLGRHLRLNKQIVLKAYKKTSGARPASLSREVDALKNLSHTYIPQVYDYVEEEGITYSVMDFIEGESLDKPLKRGERFSQPQVIAWSRQLLDALCYLHSRPPHGILHSDIKPANIMLTPQGDIRLIDFNISLALGESGAVRVGFSRGYASPEHYGIAYLAPSARSGEAETQLPTDNPETQLPTGPGTRLSRGSSTTAGGVLLDVRSDIYSLGATLYHLLTGRRPAQNADEVLPIQPGEASPAVAAIVQKAMSPNPEERYQTAADMLRAFERLYQDDPRVRAHRRRAAVAAAVLAALFLAGGACTFAGLKRMETAQAQARTAAETAEQALALISDSKAACSAGDIPGAVRLAAEALEMDSPHEPQARRALTDALGVYNLSDTYQSYRSLQLPSAPVKAVLSGGGSRAAAIAGGELFVFDTESGEQLAALPAEESALADLAFVGENTILYAGKGALRAYDLERERELWSGGPATSISVSAGGRTVAAIYRDENIATVYDGETGEALRVVSFGNRRQRVTANDVFADPEDNLFVLSGDGTHLAVSDSGGGLVVYGLEDGGEDLTVFETSEYQHFEGGFFGQYLAFSASREAGSIFAVIDMETAEQTGGFQSQNPFHVLADEGGVLVATENLLVTLDPLTGEQRELAYAGADVTAFARQGGYTLTALADGTVGLYGETARALDSLETPCDFLSMAGDTALMANRDAPSLRLLRLETHPAVFTYDRSYVHDEARLSQSGYVTLFRYDGFRVYGPDGTVAADAALPESGQVYDQQYRREADGDVLEVTYNQGLIRRYAIEDGRLLSEEMGPVPDGTLDEEFLTDRFRVTAPLHGTPVVYDRETGQQLRELEPNDYLAYVTQVGEYVITEYVTSQGTRYGLLLDENCETLARLPNLCDILPDGTLLFDDMRGNLRQSRIYSIQELLALAKNSKEETE